MSGFHDQDPRDNPPSARARMARAQRKLYDEKGQGSPPRGGRENNYGRTKEHDVFYEPLVNSIAEQIDNGEYIVVGNSGIDLTTPYRTLMLEAESMANEVVKDSLVGTEALCATLMLEMVNKYWITSTDQGTGGFDEMPNHLRALGLLMFGVNYEARVPRSRHYKAAQLESYREVYCQETSDIGGPTEEPTADGRISPVQTRKQQKAILETLGWEEELSHEDPTKATLDVYR